VLEAVAVIAGFYDVAVMGVNRSSKAVVIFGSPNTLDHSEKLRLVVIRILVEVVY